MDEHASSTCVAEDGEEEFDTDDDEDGPEKKDGEEECDTNDDGVQEKKVGCKAKSQDEIGEQGNDIPTTHAEEEGSKAKHQDEIEEQGDDLDITQGAPTKLPGSGGDSPEATGEGSSREAAVSQSNDTDLLPEGAPTLLPAGRVESPEPKGSLREAAGSRSNDDLDLRRRPTVVPEMVPEVDYAFRASKIERPEVSKIEHPEVDNSAFATSTRQPVFAELPTGMKLREACLGSRRPCGRTSLAQSDELRASLFGTHTSDPLLLSGRHLAQTTYFHRPTQHVAQLCNATPRRSLLPVRSLSCQASPSRVDGLYVSSGRLLLPGKSGALPSAQELNKALRSPRPQSRNMRVQH